MNLFHVTELAVYKHELKENYLIIVQFVETPVFQILYRWTCRHYEVQSLEAITSRRFSAVMQLTSRSPTKLCHLSYLKWKCTNGKWSIGFTLMWLSHARKSEKRIERWKLTAVRRSIGSWNSYRTRGSSSQYCHSPGLCLWVLTLLTNETASVRVNGRATLYLFTVINVTTIPVVNKIISVICQRHKNIVKRKVKQSRYRPGVARRFPGSYGS